jgi:hypothetical protein
VLLGFHQEANGLPKEYAIFCRKTLCDFGVEVYRKSTGDLDLGKSAGKELSVVKRISKMSTPTSQLLQYDFCVPEAQRLADLAGIRIDLETAIEYCNLHIEIDPTESGISPKERLRRDHTRQALCRAFLITYGRCWGSGVRAGLDDGHRQQLSLGAQQLHATVKDLRDKWVAHAVNHFDDVRVQIDVDWRADETASVRGVSVTGHHVGGFVRDWMIKFRTLASEVLALVQREIASESERLSVMARKLPLENVMSRHRVDHIPLTPTTLEPRRVRKVFR